MSKFGLRYAPLVYMSMHVTFFLFSSVFSILAYSSFYINTLLLLTWVTVSIWNGASFYMEYFSRRYESSLRALEVIESSLTEVSPSDDAGAAASKDKQ